ncbi:MAG: AAA family ATPase [Galactobacter sp.]
MKDVRLPLRRVEAEPDREIGPEDAWFLGLSPVRQVLDHGLDLGQATVITGENGVGKSTLVEGIAVAYGLNPEGGSTGAQVRSRRSESALPAHLRLVRGIGSSKRGFFLRAETMHGFYTYLEDNPGTDPEPVFHERSHGESFLDLVESRALVRGLWVLDEPESALSLNGCLCLMRSLMDLIDRGSQVILSTHSPVLAGLPGATLLEAGDWGLRESDYDSLDLVRAYRSFLRKPERYLEVLREEN